MFPTSTKILVVDDLRTIRSLVSDILKQAGYHDVVEASDGAEALKVLIDSNEKRQPIGLVISDWNMPNMTGLELLEHKMSIDALKDVPFMLLTIESERDHVLRAVSVGVDEFVVKPFSEKTLLTKMKSAWQRRKK